jgi:hypothetical protein
MCDKCVEYQSTTYYIHQSVNPEKGQYVHGWYSIYIPISAPVYRLLKDVFILTFGIYSLYFMAQSRCNTVNLSSINLNWTHIIESTTDLLLTGNKFRINETWKRNSKIKIKCSRFLAQIITRIAKLSYYILYSFIRYLYFLVNNISIFFSPMCFNIFLQIQYTSFTVLT